MAPSFQDRTPDKGAFTINEFAAWASVGHSKIYQEVRTGRLQMRKIGRKSVITLPDAMAWLSTLPLSPEVPKPSNLGRRLNER